MARTIEMLANVFMILAALVLCTSAVKDKWLQKSDGNIGDQEKTQRQLQGTLLQIPGVEWSSAEKTIVLALSTQCHFCQESAPFYKQLTVLRAVHSKRVAIVTIFPQQQEEAESFVKHYDIHTSSVLSMPLQTIGTSATPTICWWIAAGMSRNCGLASCRLLSRKTCSQRWTGSAKRGLQEHVSFSISLKKGEYVHESSQTSYATHDGFHPDQAYGEAVAAARPAGPEFPEGTAGLRYGLHTHRPELLQDVWRGLGDLRIHPQLLLWYV